ncbi:disease resistance protein RUN1-like [Carya illinoinensis]|uniref:disease resistance protein RUN1-like n=1 Tax=Carya illinoinensis TaxID=32201 RepID=UPI001C720299|nr:disease resistance protein RUN1-like [Carya illinoinensis]
MAFALYVLGASMFVSPGVTAYTRAGTGGGGFGLRSLLVNTDNATGFEGIGLSLKAICKRNESDFILDIITWVDSIMVNHTFLNVAKYPVGIESRVRDIYQHLSLERNDITCMVGIFGSGGIDNVDELKQLETLAGDHRWFGPGSRIIVTTRDQDLLNISKVDSKYELKFLAYNEARKLFSLHAFEKEEPLDSYAEVFEQSVLQVSYDGLEEREKDMFLDIACFFKGEPLADVITIFESCDFHPNYGIPKLIDKCLITVGYYIWMHDLLQDMGREIVRKESPKQPGARSRLWFHEDIRYVLEETTELQILWSENLVEVHDSVGFLDKLVDLGLYGCPNLKSFPRRLKLRSLRYLTLHKCSKLQNFPQIECKMELLSSIRLEGTAIKEWPSSIIGYLTLALNLLSLKQCVHQLQNQNELCLSAYSIILLGEDEPDSSINGCFTGIEHLSIEGSLVDLVRLPISVPHLQHLKSLSLANHPNLAIHEIHSSIGYLTGLKKLRLTRSLFFDGYPSPVFNNWYLDGFSIYCSSTLQELDLSQSGIVRLPPSIESFVELRILKLWECYNLKEILYLPPNIRELDASECFSLERFPEASTKFQFNTCGLRELRCCHKLVANIGRQVPNPSFVEGIRFQIGLAILRSNSHSWELDISGPLYLDEIIGFVFCAVLGSDPDGSYGVLADICVSINGNRLVELTDFYIYDGYDYADWDDGVWDHVYLNYSFPKSIEQCYGVDSDFAEAEGGSEGSLKEEVLAPRSVPQEGLDNLEKAYLAPGVVRDMVVGAGGLSIAD